MNNIHKLIEENNFKEQIEVNTNTEKFYNALKMYFNGDIKDFNRYYQHNTLEYRECLSRVNNEQLVKDLNKLTSDLDKKMIERLNAAKRTNDKRFDELLDSVELNSQMKVLDFGCGTGLYIDALLERDVTNIVGCEINLAAIDYCNAKYQDTEVQIINSVNTDIGNGYDLIIIANVLHHLGNSKDEVIADLVQRLNKGGQFALTELNKENPGEHHQHQTISEAEIKKYFKQLDLTVSKLISSGLVLYVFKK